VSGQELDLDLARRRLREIDEGGRWLAIACGVLCAWVIGALTVLVLTERLLSLVVPWALVAALAWLLAFSSFLAAFRRIHGRRPPVEIWIALALSPVALMRAASVVSISAARTVHPLAAAAILCDDREFLRVARLWYFDVPDLRPAIERIADARSGQRSLTSPPSAWDPGSSRFCPRCHSTYTAAAAHCADCIHVDLLPLR
jgi:hypothetical protein